MTGADVSHEGLNLEHVVHLAPLGARGAHLLDDVPDLTCEDGTARDPMDGSEPTHNPPAASLFRGRRTGREDSALCSRQPTQRPSEVIAINKPAATSVQVG